MIVIYAEREGARLDVFLAGETDFTRSQIKQLIDGGHILLDGKAVKSGKAVKKGCEVIINEPERTLDIIPQDIPLDVLYEDEHIAVINKQKGLAVHPAGGAVKNTLVNALLWRFRDLSRVNGEIRPGIVHRLDKDTTGVMVVAKTDASHLSLSRQIAERSVKKLYIALLEGALKDDGGVIDAPIARDKKERKKMAIDNGGRNAMTYYRVLERFEGNTLVEFDLKTGRTHQIRVHAKHIGHPVVGDPVYGFKKQRFNLDGQLLHSCFLEFKHPASGEIVGFSAPIPNDFARVMEIMHNVQRTTHNEGQI
ncbi:MAG: RluA family pseudouridine synthase [Firmicutes bacterium]|nr:RluA family pseudouridine synthase [Bacillota bacterium]